MSVARKASRTASASGRRAVSSSPRCSIGIAAASATSAQTVALRRASCQTSPAACPVTVTKPKLRIDAPLAAASRSITTTR
jgi:hypothetical protein